VTAGVYHDPVAEILGRNHPLVKRIRALRRSAGARRSERLFVAEGTHLADEALRRGAPVECVVHAAGPEPPPEVDAILRRARAASIAVHAVRPDLMDALQDSRSPQPILALVRLGEHMEPAGGLAALEDDGLTLLVHGIQDPGNLGSLVRSAHAAGAARVWVDGGCDIFHPRAVRATMGSIFAVPVEPASFTELIPLLRAAAVRTWAACGRGGEQFRHADFSGRCALVLGSEGSGLPESILRACDGRVTIPMHGEVESLSVAAAGAVLLFAAARRTVSDG
jgi:TrmH family RNA methyltransferase